MISGEFVLSQLHGRRPWRVPAVQIIYEMGACTWRARADEDRNLSPEMVTMLTMEMTVAGALRAHQSHRLGRF